MTNTQNTASETTALLVNVWTDKGQTEYTFVSEEKARQEFMDQLDEHHDGWTFEGSSTYFKPSQILAGTAAFEEAWRIWYENDMDYQRFDVAPEIVEGLADGSISGFTHNGVLTVILWSSEIVRYTEVPSGFED